MNIHFERRTDRPDSQGRCVIHLRTNFGNERLRISTGERCVAADWNADKGWFRKSFTDLDNATDRLKALRSRVEKTFSDLRTELGTYPTAAQLKDALSGTKKSKGPTPGLVELLDEHRAVLLGRGFRVNTLKGYKTTRNAMEEWIATLPGGMTVTNYTAAAHDALLSWLRSEKGHGQNTIASLVKRLKPFLSWVRDERGIELRIDPTKLSVEWEDVEKCWLTTQELSQVAGIKLPNNLTLVRDAFLFCCYTGLRYSDLHDLHAGNLHEWDGGKVLRLTQTKTRTGVSVYLTPSALAILDKYTDTRVRLLPVMANPVMNRYLKRIMRLAGVETMVEVVETIAGRVMKRPVPKWELVTMHTARHTFATQSLMRGMPVEVLQKVLGHAKIQTTLIYAKIVEDFQHQTMRRIWGDEEKDYTVGDSNTICAVEPAA